MMNTETSTAHVVATADRFRENKIKAELKRHRAVEIVRKNDGRRDHRGRPVNELILARIPPSDWVGLSRDDQSYYRIVVWSVDCDGYLWDGDHFVEREDDQPTNREGIDRALNNMGFRLESGHYVSDQTKLEFSRTARENYKRIRGA